MKTAQRRTRATAAQLDARAEAIAVRLLVARARALNAFDAIQQHPGLDALPARAARARELPAQTHPRH